MGLALSIAHDGIAKDLDGEDTLESRVAIEAFLREVETRAFRIAVMNVRDRDEALDIVQDCMIRLVRRYSQRPSEEWRPLFYRILQNRIRDAQRRRSVRSRVLSFFGGLESEEEYDPIVAVLLFAHHPRSTEVGPAQFGPDLEILLGKEDLAMLDDDIDFYSWLEDQPDFAPPAANGDGVG